MTYRLHIDCFTSLDQLSKKDRRDYHKVKAAVLAAGRFSVFDADKDTGKLLTALCKDQTLIVDNSCDYPWVLVRQKQPST